MLDFKKLFGKCTLTRAMAALLLALILCISACEGQSGEISTTAADTTAPAVQQTTVADTTAADSEQSDSETLTETVTEQPTQEPTQEPTEEPSEEPTEEPTEEPSEEPTEAPTEETTEQPSEQITESTFEEISTEPQASIDLSGIPAYSGNAFVALNDNVPVFKAQELVTESYETYGELDALGRCTTVMACCGKDLMPTDDRGSISSVKPTGWVQAVYPCVNGGNLYNRCHLIGWQITGENANERNLITGTRYFNEAMIPFENMIADYIKETDNHVMYRVTPIFEGDNLVASGAVMEAWSVEDNGEGICFCVYLYNVQPEVVIDYATGESYLEADGGPTTPGTETTQPDDGLFHFVLNTKSKKIHKTTCSSVPTISQKNRSDFAGTEEEVEALFGQGYTNCGNCKGTD